MSVTFEKRTVDGEEKYFEIGTHETEISREELEMRIKQSTENFVRNRSVYDSLIDEGSKVIYDEKLQELKEEYPTVVAELEPKKVINK